MHLKRSFIRNLLPVIIITGMIFSACSTAKSGVGNSPTSASPMDKNLKAIADNVKNARNQANDTSIDQQKTGIDSVQGKIDSIANRFNKISADSIQGKKDSLATDKKDSASINKEPKKKQFELSDVVNYSAKDSMVMINTNMAYLFGESKIQYETKNIESRYMRINMDSSQVYTQYVLDSVGKPNYFPKYTDGDESYEAKSMNYNFKTSKGYITGVVTQQGEGYLNAERTKKMADNTMFLEGGKYTTCDRHDHPHFYLQLTKGKVKPKKQVIFGPAYLVLADVPLPIGLPFGMFPFTSKYSSGIIMPKYGDELQRGFYLQDGGYYFAFNDYVDLAVTGSIYTRGSWGVQARSQYRKRYKFNGAFDASYIQTVIGDKDVPKEYSKSKDFRIGWTHSQDPKADPLRTFSASVNYSTSSYNHNSLDRRYDPQKLGENTKTSSVSYSRVFPGTPWRLTASFDIAQRSIDSTISLTLPNLSVNMSRVFPFKRKVRVGSEKWYEKISMSYNGEMRNHILTKENKLLKSNLLKDWENGIRHNIPLSASYKLFDYVDISLNANYTERWYTKKYNKVYNPTTDRLENTDTINGFNRVFDFNGGVSASTVMYGFYEPLFFRNKIKMIRHRFTPSISYSFTPDFGQRHWGYWKDITYYGKDGIERTMKYSPYEGQLFGVPSMGRSSMISFSADNNIEAKIAQKDTVDKKISLIDNFRWGVGYNMAADSFKWTNINTSLTLRFSQDFVLNLSGDFDPYMYDYVRDERGEVHAFRVDRLKILNGKGIGSLVSTGTSFNYTLNNNNVKKLLGLLGIGPGGDKEDKPKDGKDKPDPGKPDEKQDETKKKNTSLLHSHDDDDEGQYDEYGYLKTEFPWSLGINYSVNVMRDRYIPEKERFKYRYTHNLSFNGNLQPTKNWSFNFNMNYDVERKKITNLMINLTRDMHCWSLTGSVIPIGFYKSYNITIGVKSSLLHDLKWNKRRSDNNNARWY